jgi:carboxypeptidase family protein
MNNLRNSILLIWTVLLLLHSMPAQNTADSLASGPYVIAGTVVNAVGGHPLARALVTIGDTRNREVTQNFVVSEDGRFEFHVRAGKFSLQAARRGFITAAYDQHEQFSTALVTGAGLDTEHLVLRIAPAAVLAGKVTDESGEPVRQTQVALYRETHGLGMSRIRRFRQETTNDQGGFEFAPLDAGTYFVSVSGKPWYAVHPVSSQPGGSPTAVDSSLDTAYPVTYYGDATDSDDAIPIPLRGGDHLDIEIHLTPVPALHLVFRPPEGENGFNLPVLQRPAFDGMEVVPTDGLQQISPGQYEITGVPAGRYSVRGPGFQGSPSAGTEVDFNSNGEELSVPTDEATTSIKATLKAEPGTALMAQMQVALRNPHGRVGAVSIADEQGNVDFANVAPGQYQVIAGSPNKAFSITRIVSQGNDTPGHTLTVPSGSSLAVTFIVAGGDVSVEGVAKRDGKPMSGVMIVLVPKDPENNRDRFRRDQSDFDGTFTLRSVIPGEYTILAIEDGWDLDWAKPAVIEHYAAHGQQIVVKEQASATMKVQDAVAVQMK